MWDILVQLSSIQVSGRWLLAPGLWQLVSCYGSLAACLWIGQQQEARSQKPKIKPCFVNYLRDTTLEVVSKPQPLNTDPIILAQIPAS
jgi:hypothetical protein